MNAECDWQTATIGDEEVSLIEPLLIPMFLRWESEGASCHRNTKSIRYAALEWAKARRDCIATNAVTSEQYDRLSRAEAALDEVAK